MNSKRKVQFDMTTRVKKITRHSEEYESDEEIEKTEKPKHTLDSDEEDETDKFKLLNQDRLNGFLSNIGQEAKTKDFDDDIKITPFNMKDELDDGNLDEDGFYHWKSKNKDELADAWLDNIEWANVNTFKNKYNLSKEGNDEENDDDDDDDETETTEKLKGESSFDNSEESQLELFKSIVTLLKPGETVIRAIKRFGNSSKLSQSNSKAGLSASQRWGKKKVQVDKTDNVDSEQIKKDAESLEKLTGYANYFIDQGFYDIYEETLESLNYKMSSIQTKKNSTFDMFADETENMTASVSGTSTNHIEDSIVKWIYKKENTDDAEINGPFTSDQMLQKSLNNEFTEKGVWCRKVNESSTSDFYNSKRIDFDLYT